MMLDVKRALTIVKAISDLGVHVSVDDYGTGFSWLRYLRDLSIGCLKLDRSFVNDLETNPDSRIIVESATGKRAAGDSGPSWVEGFIARTFPNLRPHHHRRKGESTSLN